jgi:hypothetical protein
MENLMIKTPKEYNIWDYFCITDKHWNSIKIQKLDNYQYHDEKNSLLYFLNPDTWEIENTFEVEDVSEEYAEWLKKYYNVLHSEFSKKTENILDK